MSYYDALVAKWASLSGTTAEKLTQVNTLTVPGPSVEVPVSAVVGYLMLSGKFSGFMTYAAGSSFATPQAQVAAKELAAVINCPNAPDFAMGNATAAAVLTAFINAVVADPASGLTAQDQTAILALATPPTPWCTAPVALGGAALGGVVTEADLGPAGGLT
jgi:hypothetical protein